MWSYYNKHEGVCLDLNMDHVAKYINVNYGMMVTTQGREVQYRDIVNKPNYYRDQEDFFSYQIYTKAKAWEHEQEVRLFIFKPFPMFMKFPPFQHDKTEFNHKEIRTFVIITHRLWYVIDELARSRVISSGTFRRRTCTLGKFLDFQ